MALAMEEDLMVALWVDNDMEVDMMYTVVLFMVETTTITRPIQV